MASTANKTTFKSYTKPTTTIMGVSFPLPQETFENHYIKIGKIKRFSTGENMTMAQRYKLANIIVQMDRERFMRNSNSCKRWLIAFVKRFSKISFSIPMSYEGHEPTRATSKHKKRARMNKQLNCLAGWDAIEEEVTESLSRQLHLGDEFERQGPLSSLNPFAEMNTTARKVSATMNKTDTLIDTANGAVRSVVNEAQQTADVMRTAIERLTSQFDKLISKYAGMGPEQSDFDRFCNILDVGKFAFVLLLSLMRGTTKKELMTYMLLLPTKWYVKAIKKLSELFLKLGLQGIADSARVRLCETDDGMACSVEDQDEGQRVVGFVYQGLGDNNSKVMFPSSSDGMSIKDKFVNFTSDTMTSTKNFFSGVLKNNILSEVIKVALSMIGIGTVSSSDVNALNAKLRGMGTNMAGLAVTVAQIVFDYIIPRCLKDPLLKVIPMSWLNKAEDAAQTQQFEDFSMRMFFLDANFPNWREDIRHNGAIIRHVQDLKQLAEKIYQKCPIQKHEPTKLIYMKLDTAWRDIREAITKIPAYMRNGRDRMKPACIYVNGPPGCGKSTSVVDFVKLIAQRVLGDGRPLSEIVYERAAGVTFWDGYFNQPIVVYNDVLQTYDTPTVTQTLNELTQVLDDAVMPLNMAHLNDKGNRFMAAKVVIINSQKNIIADDKVTSWMASGGSHLDRRFTYAINFKINSRYCKMKGDRRTEIPDWDLINRESGGAHCLPKKGVLEIRKYHDIKQDVLADDCIDDLGTFSKDIVKHLSDYFALGDKADVRKAAGVTLVNEVMDSLGVPKLPTQEEMMNEDTSLLNNLTLRGGESIMKEHKQGPGTYGDDLWNIPENDTTSATDDLCSKCGFTLDIEGECLQCANTASDAWTRANSGIQCIACGWFDETAQHIKPVSSCDRCSDKGTELRVRSMLARLVNDSDRLKLEQYYKPLVEDGYGTQSESSDSCLGSSDSDSDREDNFVDAKPDPRYTPHVDKMYKRTTFARDLMWKCKDFCTWVKDKIKEHYEKYKWYYDILAGCAVVMAFVGVGISFTSYGTKPSSSRPNEQTGEFEPRVWRRRIKGTEAIRREFKQSGDLTDDKLDTLRRMIGKIYITEFERDGDDFKEWGRSRKYNIVAVTGTTFLLTDHEHEEILSFREKEKSGKCYYEASVRFGKNLRTQVNHLSLKAICEAPWHQIKEGAETPEIGMIKLPLGTNCRDYRAHFLTHTALELVSGTQACRIDRHWDEQQEIERMYTSDFHTCKIKPHTDYRKNRLMVADGMITHKGDCGSLYVTGDRKVAGNIIGIHFAYHPNWGAACATVVSREELDVGIKALEEIATAPCNFETSAIVYQSEDLVSRVDSIDVVKFTSEFNRVPNKSRLKKTNLEPAIVEHFGPTDMGPALLRPFKDDNGVVHSPLANAQEKVTTPVPMRVFDKSMMDKGIKHVVDMHENTLVAQQRYPRSDRKVLGINEALGRCWDMKPVDLKTSPGYAYTSQGYSKKDIIERVDDLTQEHVIQDNEAGRFFLEKHMERLAAAKSGELVDTLFTDNLKDEKRPGNKRHNPRLFHTAPLDLQVLIRQYFGNYISFLNSSFSENENQIGINVDSKDWTHLYDRITKFGPKYCFSGDLKAFDSTISSQLIEAFADMANMWYDDGLDNAKVRKTLMRSVSCRHHLVWNTIHFRGKGNPSGHAATTPVNCAVLSLLFRFCYMETVDPTLDTWYDNVELITYGDDNGGNINEAVIDVFNFKVMVQWFKQAGLTMTMADKGSEVLPYQHVSEISFLKRLFRPHKDGFVRAPVDKKCEELLNSLRYSEQDPGNGEIFSEIATQIQRFAFHEGREAHREMTSKLKTIFSQSRVRLDHEKLKTYDEIWSDMYVDGVMVHSIIG